MHVDVIHLVILQLRGVIRAEKRVQESPQSTADWLSVSQEYPRHQAAHPFPSLYNQAESAEEDQRSKRLQAENLVRIPCDCRRLLHLRPRITHTARNDTHSSKPQFLDFLTYIWLY